MQSENQWHNGSVRQVGRKGGSEARLISDDSMYFVKYLVVEWYNAVECGSTLWDNSCPQPAMRLP